MPPKSLNKVDATYYKWPPKLAILVTRTYIRTTCGVKNALAPSLPPPLKRLKEYDTNDMSLPHTYLFALFLTC